MCIRDRGSSVEATQALYYTGSGLFTPSDLSSYNTNDGVIQCLGCFHAAAQCGKSLRHIRHCSTVQGRFIGSRGQVITALVGQGFNLGFLVVAGKGISALVKYCLLYTSHDRRARCPPWPRHCLSRRPRLLRPGVCDKRVRAIPHNSRLTA